MNWSLLYNNIAKLNIKLYEFCKMHIGENSMEENKKLILPFDDFMSIGDEGLEKVKEEHEEEVKKTLQDGLEIADEINGDEHVKAFPEEVKMLKNEKLILKEPNESLNEELAYPAEANFVYDVYDAITSVIYDYRKKGLNPWVDDVDQAIRFFHQRFNYGNDEYDESLDEGMECGKGHTKENAEDLKETLSDRMDKLTYNNCVRYLDMISDLADSLRIDLEDYIDEDSEILSNLETIEDLADDISYKVQFGSDEALNEALPRDLAGAYKSSSAYQVGTGYSTYMNLPSKNNPRKQPYFDPQKANYTEITPEEAIALKKAGRAEEIRVIFDGQLVTFNEKGLQSSGKYMAKGSYQKDNGTFVDDTRQLTFNQIVKQADKIYLADELLYGDSELQTKRAERKLNPESRYPDSSVMRMGTNLIGQAYNFVPGDNDEYDTAIQSYDSVASLTAQLDKYKKNVAYYTDALRDATEEWEKENAQEKLDRFTRLVHNTEVKIAKAKARDKGLAARTRYMASEIELMKPFAKFKELKLKVRSAQNELQGAKNNYDNFKASGSSDAQYYKRQLESLNNRLKDIMRDIAANEIALENEEDKSQAKLDEYAAKAAAAQKAVDQVQAELDKFLGRIS